VTLARPGTGAPTTTARRLLAGRSVTFNTSAGRTATTDNIQGGSADPPHALQVSAGLGRTALAFPPGEN
jgi:hypothetical protein